VAAEPGSGGAPGGETGTESGGETGRERVRPRWWARRRTLVVTSAVAAGAVLLAGVGDVVIEHVARERLVSAATCRLHPAGRVSADLTGTLAGLRQLTGDVGTVRISARDVRRGGLGMSVEAELHGVTTKGTSTGGSATATVPYGRLAGQLG
jgi:hypothetical protein